MGNIDFIFSQLCTYRVSAEQPHTKEGLKRCGRHDSLLFCIVFIDHVMYGLTQNKALKRCATHGLDRKWNLRHGPACFDYCRLAWSAALLACLALILLSRIASPWIRWAWGRIASTVFFCGEFSQICEMFLGKFWKFSPNLETFWEKWGNSDILAKIRIWKENHWSPNFDMSESIFFSGDISLSHKKI